MTRIVEQSGDAHCWTERGVWGDSTCPELATAGHCRNCGVYAAGASRLLDRPLPDDYVESWTELLAREKPQATTEAVEYLVFRIGASWLGLRATALRELTWPAVVRTVPHRAAGILLGLTAVRGEIHLCVSLHALLDEPTVPDLAGRGARFLMASHQGQAWAIPADEVDAIRDVEPDAIEPLPAALRRRAAVFTTGMIERDGKAIGLLDADMVFATLARRIA